MPSPRLRFGLAHGFAGTAEVVDAALTLALGPCWPGLPCWFGDHAAVFQVVEQLVQPVAERLLALPQVAEGVPLLLALLALLPLLPLLALLPGLVWRRAFAAAPALVLTLA